MELAVNMPEQDPQVGQALSSISRSLASVMELSAEAIMGSTRSSLLPPMTPSTGLPASIGPPDTNTVGMLRRRAASIIPGVILSQLDTQIRASAQCALTMYSMASAIISRDGRE